MPKATNVVLVQEARSRLESLNTISNGLPTDPPFGVGRGGELEVEDLAVMVEVGD